MNLEKVHSDWDSFLKKEINKEYFKILSDKLINEEKKYEIFPEENQRLNILTLPPNEIKTVIIGQDPYPTKGHANGLCFSVNKEVNPLPKSLVNIFKEIKKEYTNFYPKNGDLTNWFKQGVFLLNTILTIRKGEPLSHKGLGWEIFTQNMIKFLNHEQKNIVFLLWGKNAHTFENLLDKSKHLVIKTSHPSPLGYTKSGKDFISFKDSNQFSKTNLYLSSNNKDQIHW